MYPAAFRSSILLLAHEYTLFIALKKKKSKKKEVGRDLFGNKGGRKLQGRKREPTSL